ncbi:MAG TPA: hypothetical protein VLC97_15115 [Rhodanobacteraceae bacterium]|nr:hypothetical protein [Rhodanobacteraceae bacterium]
MILRRVIEHLKKQQWTAVVIELVIVIAGVFIGLQVNDWKDARRDRAREVVYLESIATELDESIASIQQSIGYSNDRSALDELLIDAATDPELVRADPGRFVFAITRGGYTHSPSIRGYTFETIKSTGDLQIIRDRQLVLDLMKFYATVQGQSQWGPFRTFCQTEYFRRSAGILTAKQLMQTSSDSGPIPSADLEDAMGAYRRMLARPDFIEWLPTTLSNRTVDVRFDTRWLEDARSLRARILALPGVRMSKN